MSKRDIRESRQTGCAGADSMHMTTKWHTSRYDDYCLATHIRSFLETYT